MESKKESYEKRYRNRITKIYADTSICKKNRILFKKFFDFQEVKLKRINSMPKLDDSSYNTLYKYIVRFVQVNHFFNNKPWVDLTKADIQRVYDGLEDDIILRKDGKPIRTKTDYYNKVFKSKPFDLAGKKDIAKEVIQYQRKENSEVSFINEVDFRRLVSYTNDTKWKFILWLAWDYGENISSILRLKKSDFYRQTTDDGESEYMLNWRKEILKRSRSSRSDLNVYPETVEIIDLYLQDFEKDSDLFTFDYRNAHKYITSIATKAKVYAVPTGKLLKLKDLRSGMACDLLQKGWNTDEVNARLGHKPSSSEIDKYVNFLAIDRKRPKKKLEEFKLKKLEKSLEDSRQKEKLQAIRMETMQHQLQLMQEQMLKVVEQQEKINVSENKSVIDQILRSKKK